MGRRRYTDAQRTAALTDASTLGVREAARRHSVSPSAISRWRSMEPTGRDVRLGPGGPPAGVATNRLRTGDREQHPLLQANVAKVHSALMESFRGRPATLQDLYDDMLDRDGRVAAVVATRVLAIQGRPWSVKPPEGYEDDPQATMVAERCGLILARIKAGGTLGKHAGGGWATAVGNMASAIPRGFSVSEMEWGVSREGWKVPLALHWRHPNRFVFSPELEIQLADGGSTAAGQPLDTWGPDKFIVHSPVAGRAGYPTRRGTMLGMVLPSLGKRSDLKGWLKAVERWGQPIAVAEIDGSNPGDNTQAEILEMLRSLYHGSNGVFWGGVKIKALDGSGQLRSEVFRDLIQELNTEIAIVGLGQNLTTEVQGGSYAAASAHNLVRYDILTADCAELDATITDQLLEPIVRYNWPGMPVPRYVTETQLRAEPTLADVQAGLFTPDERRASLGHKPMPDGQGAEFAAPVIVAEAAPTDTPTPGADMDRPEAIADAVPASEPASAAALNGAQIDALQSIIVSVADGVLPKETAAKLITIGFPVSEQQAADLLAAVQPKAPVVEPVPDANDAPPGGAATAPPFEGTKSAPSTTSPTSEQWSPGYARSLFSSLAGSGHSPSSKS